MANNFDERTMNNIKNMVDSGNIQGAISQISPEMIESFSKMMNNSSSQSKQNPSNSTYKSNMNNSSYHSQNSNTNNTQSYQQDTANSANSGFDFSNIDINTMMKMKSIMENMNNKNDPSYKLLNSLKPYLRESRQEKIDQYANLLNFSKIADAFNNSQNQ